MTEPLNIAEDADCCDVWPKIAHAFEWKCYWDQPGMLTMPHVKDRRTDDRWFVNFCPACGKSARNRNMRMERIKS